MLPGLQKLERRCEHKHGHQHVNDFPDPDEASEDAPEHEVRLNIRLPQPSNHHTNNGRPHSANLTKNTALSLSVPVNPLSSMYGSNNGLENLDSIGNFLPRPHTVSSPVISNRNSARNSPVVKGPSSGMVSIALFVYLIVFLRCLWGVATPFSFHPFLFIFIAYFIHSFSLFVMFFSSVGS